MGVNEIADEVGKERGGRLGDAMARDCVKETSLAHSARAVTEAKSG